MFGARLELGAQSKRAGGPRKRDEVDSSVGVRAGIPLAPRGARGPEVAKRTERISRTKSSGREIHHRLSSRLIEIKIQILQNKQSNELSQLCIASAGAGCRMPTAWKRIGGGATSFHKFIFVYVSLRERFRMYTVRVSVSVSAAAPSPLRVRAGSWYNRTRSLAA